MPAYLPHQMIFAVIFSVRLSVLKYGILKHTVFLGCFLGKVATAALSGSIPVRVYVIRKVVDKAFSAKTCDFEFGFHSTPCDPEQSRLADLWQVAGKMCGVVVVKGVRVGWLVGRGALAVCLSSQRPVIALLVFLGSCVSYFSPVKTALSQMKCHVERH